MNDLPPLETNSVKEIKPKGNNRHEIVQIKTEIKSKKQVEKNQ